MKQMESKKLCKFIKTMFIVYCSCLCSMKSGATGKPLIFPIPQQSEFTKENFILDETVSIVIPPNASKKDIFLANFLVSELSDKYGLVVKIETVSDIPV